MPTTERRDLQADYLFKISQRRSEGDNILPLPRLSRRNRLRRLARKLSTGVSVDIAKRRLKESWRNYVSRFDTPQRWLHAVLPGLVAEMKYMPRGDDSERRQRQRYHASSLTPAENTAAGQRATVAGKAVRTP